MENSTCGICTAESETLRHVLIECSHARLFWSAAKEILMIKLPKLHPSTWEAYILCDPSITQKDREIIITMTYSIWTSRNSLTHGEGGINPVKSMQITQETLQMLEFPKEMRTPKQPRQPCKWSKPLDIIVKLNSDGAISEDPCMAPS